MADREDKSNLPPIPDGGLTDAMPDWLRRPPAWRALPDRDLTVPEPEGAAELPEPDDSVIDPRTFLSDDDLPAWLTSLGQPRAARGSDGDDARSRVASAPAAERPSDVVPPRFVPTTPPVAPPASRASNARAEAAPRQPQASTVSSPPAWQGGWAVVILAVLLVVAIAAIIVLVL